MTVVVTTFGAIVFGLCSTLVLLNIVRSPATSPHPPLAASAIDSCSQFEKALPALPISIFLGIAVYFSSVFALAPMLAACTQPPF